MQLRVLSAGDVRRAVHMAEAIEAVGEAFARLSSGGADAPLRTGLATPSGTSLFMPATVGGATEDAATWALGAKIVSVFPGNRSLGLPAVSALVVLVDAATGLPRAVMDGTWLTALRTGAAGGVAARHLARADAAVLTVFGAGVQARTQIEAVRCVRSIEEVRVVARSRESASRLAAELRDVRARVFEESARALAGADIVVAATTSRHPVFRGRDVEPGAHVTGVGSYTPDMREVDAALVLASTVIVDTREGALAEAGDLLDPIARGVIGEDHIRAELGEVVRGVHPGRTRPEEITFFKSVGNAVQDVAVARRVVDRAEAEGWGTLVEL